MSDSNFAVRYPLFVPLCGVTGGILLYEAGAEYLSCGILILFAAAALLCRSHLKIKDSLRQWLFSATICVAFGAAGLFSALIQKPTTYDFENEVFPRYAEGIVINREQGELEYIEAKINKLFDDAGNQSDTPDLKAVIRTDASGLETGDVFTFVHELRPIENSSPFNASLIRRGFNYTQYISGNELHRKKSSEDPIERLNAETDMMRHRIAVAIDKSDLGKETSAFLKAILIGETESLSSGTRETFSAAGTAHILALSGMHVGILAGLVLLILYPLNTVGKGKLRRIMVIPVVWLFVLLTGFIPSAVRAAVMLTAVITGLVSERKNAPLNALFAAMILILLISPGYLFSAGLQLSFCCVAALLVFSPASDFIGRKYPFTRKTVNLLAGCLIASVASLGLTAYYFHQISLWGILFNLIILPLLPLYISLGAIFSVWSLAGNPPSLIANILDAGFNSYSALIRAIESLYPLSADVWISIPVLISFYLLLISLAYIIRKRTGASVTAFVSCLILVPVLAVFYPGEKPENGFSIGMRRDADLIEVTQNGKSSIIPLSSKNGVNLVTVYSDTLAIVDRNLPDIDSLERIKCSLLLYCHGYYGSIERLLLHYDPEYIVIMPSVYPAREEDILTEARNFGVACHSIRKNGPLTINAE